MESPLCLHMYLQQLLRTDRADVKKLTAAPPNFEPMCWVYEHLRQTCLELTVLIVSLRDVCTAALCPKMIATAQYTYLCAAHPKANQECCAIDYMTHTLDMGVNQLTSEKFFRSRLDIKPPDLKTFQELSRRLYRLFSHAYFHHSDVFHLFEAETHLTERFIALCNVYKLVQKDAQLINPDTAFPKPAAAATEPAAVNISTTTTTAATTGAEATSDEPSVSSSSVKMRPNSMILTKHL